MKNLIKKALAVVILAYALYGIYIWKTYKEQEEIYYIGIELHLASICRDIMQETYRQYLGPVRSDKNEHKGSVSLMATVYFPNMAPQNINCSIYLDNFWIGYDENSGIKIDFLGTDYAPSGFYLRGQSPTLFVKTTFKKLHRFIDPIKKPTFDSTMNETSL